MGKLIDREKVRRGSQCTHAKLDEDKVKWIRGIVKRRREMDFERAQYTDTALAKRFGVSRSAIESVVAGLTWGHLHDG